MLNFASPPHTAVTPPDSTSCSLKLTGSIFCSCWMLDVSYNWIYKIPCIGSVIANLFFLVAIVIILVSKLHTDVSERAAMIKTAKAIGERDASV